MKMTDLKKQLSLMEKEELVNLICRLYKGSTQSRDMLDIELCGNDAEKQVVEECKKQISKSFLIQNFSLKAAKKVISDFKKICHNKENLAGTVILLMKLTVSRMTAIISKIKRELMKYTIHHWILVGVLETKLRIYTMK